MTDPTGTDPLTVRAVPAVPAELLRWHCDPDSLGFDRTEEIPETKGIIGQDRAVEALRLAFSIRSKGHNVYVSGAAGTGRTTTVKHLLETLDTGRKAPSDIVYVHNFRLPDSPTAITLPTGRGQSFRREMEEFVVAMRRNIAQVLESDQYKERTKQVVERFKETEKEAVRLFEDRIRDESFALVQIQIGPYSKPEIAPLINGEPVPLDRLEALTLQEKFSVEEHRRLRAKHGELRQLMEDTFKKARDVKRKLRDELAQLEKEFGRPIIAEALDDIREEYPSPKVAEYLDQVRDEVLSNMGQFLDKEGEEGEEQVRLPHAEDERYRRFLVNVLVDNTGVERPPVVLETSPNYRNLFGTIEKVVDRSGHWRSDFLHIKAGSVLRANGGFLVINLLDAIVEPSVWPALKRTLKNQQVDIQVFDAMYLVLHKRHEAGADQDRCARGGHRRSRELPHSRRHGSRLSQDLQGEGGVRLGDAAHAREHPPLRRPSPPVSAPPRGFSAWTRPAWPRWSSTGCGSRAAPESSPRASARSPTSCARRTTGPDGWRLRSSTAR